MKIKFICNAIKWRDKVNGNTYHSVRITRCEDGKVLVGQFQYGYGDQYRYTALQEMLDAGWIPEKYGKKHQSGITDLYLYERENDYPIMWNVSYGKKKDCIANGKL